MFPVCHPMGTVSQNSPPLCCAWYQLPSNQIPKSNQTKEMYHFDGYEILKSLKTITPSGMLSHLIVAMISAAAAATFIRLHVSTQVTNGEKSLLFPGNFSHWKLYFTDATAHPAREVETLALLHGLIFCSNTTPPPHRQATTRDGHSRTIIGIRNRMVKNQTDFSDSLRSLSWIFISIIYISVGSKVVLLVASISVGNFMVYNIFHHSSSSIGS